MNYYILLTAPLVWLIICFLGVKSGYTEEKLEELAGGALVLTVIAYLMLGVR